MRKKKQNIKILISILTVTLFVYLSVSALPSYSSVDSEKKRFEMEVPVAVSFFTDTIKPDTGSARVFDVGTELTEEITAGPVKTGHIARLYNSTSIWTGSYEIAIKGDANGDGTIDSLDVDAIANHLLKNDASTLSGVYLEAADIDLSGVDILDLLSIKKKILNNDMRTQIVLIETDKDVGKDNEISVSDVLQ